MKTSRFSEHQIIGMLKQAEAGLKVADICREQGVSQATFYKWKAKYGGMESSDVKRLRALEEENRRLKRMYAELSLDHQILKEVVEKKL
jgi:putative transposase